MGKQASRPASGQHASEFMKLLNSFTGRHSPYMVFRDFVALSARAISNQRVFFQQTLEDEYLQIAGKYTRPELDKFSELLGMTLVALSEQHQDFLGHCYMALDFGNEKAGQFFTPYTISKMMAGLQLAGMTTLPDKGYIAVHEPALGAGGMLIATAEVFRGLGFDPSTQLFCVGVEIDSMVAEMAYVQLAAIGVPAQVVVGDSIRMTAHRQYFTPAYVQHGWYERRLSEVTPNVLPETQDDLAIEPQPLAETCRRLPAQLPAVLEQFTLF